MYYFQRYSLDDLIVQCPLSPNDRIKPNASFQSSFILVFPQRLCVRVSGVEKEVRVRDNFFVESNRRATPVLKKVHLHQQAISTLTDDVTMVDARLPFYHDIARGYCISIFCPYQRLYGLRCSFLS